MIFLNKLSIIIYLCVASQVLSMTRQQIKNSGRLMKKTCMPKNDVTEEMVGGIEQGKFVEDKKVMCYIACIYSTSAVIKNNKIMHDAMIKQIDMMFPSDMKDGAKAAVESCRDISKKYKDVCEVSYWTAKCLYDYSPANYIFP